MYKNSEKASISRDNEPAHKRVKQTDTSNNTTSSTSESSSRVVDFLIVGAQKAGTTALAKNLSKHPDIFVKNECQFFTFCWGFGVDWFREQLRSQKPVIGEKTPELIYCDDCAPRIKEVCPNAKFILCLRDPIKRAFSSWNMEIETKRETLSFSECIDRELATMMNEKRTYGTAEYHFVQRGFYMDQIERFQKHFPDRSQMLIVIAERLKANPTEEYSRIVKFLGVKNFTFTVDDDNVGEYRAGTTIPPQYLQKLKEIYAPHNQRLFAYLGYEIPEWSEERQTGNRVDKQQRIPEVVTTTAENPEISDPAPEPPATSPWANPITSLAGDFARIGSRCGTDKIYQHGYHRFYPIHIERFRTLQGGGMLEIGVDESHSLNLWLEYFPHAFIYGIDIGVCKEGERFKIFQADQSKTSQLENIAKNLVTHPIFLIVDDGSHVPDHQVQTFNYFFTHLLQPGGVYIIEDVETSYWTRNGLYGYQTQYGYHHQYSAIEIFKDLLDDINMEFLTNNNRRAQDRRVSGCFSPETRADISMISFGQNCIIINKKTAEDREKYDDRKYRFSRNL